MKLVITFCSTSVKLVICKPCVKVKLNRRMGCGKRISFWATVCKTVRPMLSVPCPVCLSVCPVCPVCDVGVLWPNGWTDQHETWHAGRPRPRQLCVRLGPSSLSPKGGLSPQIFGPCLLRPNGWIDEAGTWHGGRPQPRRLCVRWGSIPHLTQSLLG